MATAVDPTVRDMLETIQQKESDDGDEDGQFSNAYFLTWPLRTEILVIGEQVSLEDILSVAYTSFYPLLTQKKYVSCNNGLQYYEFLFTAMKNGAILQMNIEAVQYLGSQDNFDDYFSNVSSVWVAMSKLEHGRVSLMP